MLSRVMKLAALPLFALPAVLRAQAALEYALRSAGSAVGGSGGTTLAGCKLDASLVSCLGQSYPRTAVVVAVVICLLIVRWLAFHRGYR